jgi:hypothetical protein
LEELQLSNNDSSSQLAYAINNLSRQTQQVQAAILATNGAIVAMQGVLATRIDSLKNTLVDVERQKVLAKTEVTGNFLEDVQKDAGEVDARMDSEIKKLKKEYQESIDRNLDQLSEEIAIDVEPMHYVINQLNEINNNYTEPANAFYDQIKDAYTGLFNERYKNLDNAGKKVTENFEVFIKSRENLANQIEEMAVPILSIRDTTVVSVPFWIIGINEDGKEKTHVVPIMECQNREVQATRTKPFIEHLAKPTNLDFEDIAMSIAQESNINLAREKRIDFRILKDGLKNFANKMIQKQTMHASFAEALEKFEEVYM